MEQNTPQVWDNVWKNSVSPDEAAYFIKKESLTVRWRRIESIVNETYGSFSGLRTIEIGAGYGKYSALMASRGASATIADYSDKALERSREFFTINGLSAEYVQCNALEPPSELLGKFDISMSFGLTEHFSGEERIRIHRSHIDLLRPGGTAFISVPNSLNPPYRILKAAAEASGKWSVGEEYPFTHRELAGICKKIGAEDFYIFGDSFIASFDFINPVKLARRLMKKKTDFAAETAAMKPEKASPFDDRFSYALVLVIRKS